MRLEVELVGFGDAPAAPHAGEGERHCLSLVLSLPFAPKDRAFPCGAAVTVLPGEGVEDPSDPIEDDDEPPAVSASLSMQQISKII